MELKHNVRYTRWWVVLNKYIQRYKGGGWG